MSKRKSSRIAPIVALAMLALVGALHVTTFVGHDATRKVYDNGSVETAGKPSDKGGTNGSGSYCLMGTGGYVWTDGGVGTEGYIWTDALTEMAAMKSWVDPE